MGISSIVGKRQSFPDFLWSTGSWKDMVAVTRHPSVFISLSGAGEKARLVEQKTGEHSRTVELFTDRGRILQMKLQEKNEGGTE